MSQFRNAVRRYQTDTNCVDRITIANDDGQHALNVQTASAKILCEGATVDARQRRLRLWMGVPVTDKIQTLVELGGNVGKALRVIQGARVPGPTVASIWAGDNLDIDLTFFGADARRKQQAPSLPMPEPSLTVFKPVLNTRFVNTHVQRAVGTTDFMHAMILAH